MIQCHDIDTSIHHPLYDGTAHPEFRFTVGTATGINGKRVYLLLGDDAYPPKFV